MVRASIAHIALAVKLITDWTKLTNLKTNSLKFYLTRLKKNMHSFSEKLQLFKQVDEIITYESN